MGYVYGYYRFAIAREGDLDNILFDSLDDVSAPNPKIALHVDVCASPRLPCMLTCVHPLPCKPPDAVVVGRTSLCLAYASCSRRGICVADC